MTGWDPQIARWNCTGLHREGSCSARNFRIWLMHKDLGFAPNCDHVQSNLRGMSRVALGGPRRRSNAGLTAGAGDNEGTN